ncbi:TPA: transposase [Salmonella enterica subsp. diarizonae serovar 61:l,v:z35]
MHLKRSTAPSKKQGKQVPEVQEITDYVVVVTTLRELSAEVILGLYRQRWQIELAFKRMKSLIGLRYLKKKNPAGVQAWLQGKLFVACLLERLLAISGHFPLKKQGDDLNISASRWQAMSLMYHLLSRSFCPVISLFACISEWDKMQRYLKGSRCRKRRYQTESLKQFKFG